jgi:hypothetical protein
VVRKQLYLRDDQEIALKERAAATGLSEAELVRQAVDLLLADEVDAVDDDLAELLAAADAAAQAHRLPPGVDLDRDALHPRS